MSVKISSAPLNRSTVVVIGSGIAEINIKLEVGFTKLEVIFAAFSKGLIRCGKQHGAFAAIGLRTTVAAGLSNSMSRIARFVKIGIDGSSV